MEVPNSGAESQTSDQSQPIHETNGHKTAEDPIQETDTVKKKRGRPPRAQAKSPPIKMSKEEDEDVCFICFDGGSLVLCDRRGCPKAYHPACVKRDEAFFRSKAKWTCGWHICSVCQKAAYHMCYTCTYSLCKGCIKKADYVCVRGDKGFCTVCMKTIMLIENGGQEKDEKAQVDFDDKTSWEYLFKVYWIYLKGKLSLTLDELTQAKNPLKEASSTASTVSSTCVHTGDNDLKNVKSPLKEASSTASVVSSTCVHNGDNDMKKVPSDVSQTPEAIESKRRKTDEQISVVHHKETVTTKKLRTDERSSAVASKDWATKELLDFVAHMKNGDTSVLTQFDVQELMLEYIKRNNLRDPRKKSQILCDSRLKVLFGKPRVGHFEMLKLLEFHFFINEDIPKNTIKSITKQLDPDWNIDNMVTAGKEKKRRKHKKTEERAPQNKIEEYAAIDVHNMNLIYLRRKLMENLIEDGENFQKKVIGSIVRIRITGSDLKHDMYRLVQVVGTSKADAPYKIGNKSADIVLEVLNLDKKEIMSIDRISNQDLSEDECRRLRQSIKCGLVKRFTVGEIQDKAVSLQSVRLNDLMEAEILKLNNLRDRASEKGHKKSLREYVEKLQLLKTPEGRERRLREIPEVHSDPKMNPDYETDDNEEYFNKEHGDNTKPKYTGISRKNTSSVKKGKDFSNNVNGRSWKIEEGPSSPMATGRISMKNKAQGPSSSGRPQSQVDYNASTVTNRSHNSASETSTSSNYIKNTPISINSELDKIWHYRDPSGKVQGPFCMVQLQKWSTTGYFPQDMRIWTHREDESLLLNDVLKQQLNIKAATDKVGIRVEGLTVRTTNLLSTQKPVNHGKLSGTHGATGQSSVQSWIGNDTPSFGKSNESNMTDLASPTPAGNVAGTSNVSSVFDIANTDLMDLPSPTPKETTTHVSEKVQNAVNKEAGNVGGTQLADTGKEWTAYSPSDRVVTRSANIEQAITTSPTPEETTTHVDEKVQHAEYKETGNVGGTQLSETGKEWTTHSPSDRVVTTSSNMEQASTTSPTPKETMTHVDEKVQNAVCKEAGNVGVGQLHETGKEWTSYSSSDQAVTKSANMEQAITSSPKPNETATHADGKVQNAVYKEAGNVGGPQLPETGKEWTAYSPNDRVVSTSANMEQAITTSSTPKETMAHVDEKVQNAEYKEAGDVGAAQLPEIGKEWTAYSPNDRVVTSANMEQAVPSSSPPSSQPGNDYLPSWQGVRETIEFSTLAEESVSDLLAEVDAMEAQNGYPSPTSRRNSFVEDLFNGSFDDFSPTPSIQGSRSDPFSSSGAEVHFPFQLSTSTAAATTTTIATTTSTTVGSSQGNSNNAFDFVKWPEIPQEAISKETLDVNNSVKANEQERDTNASETSHDRAGGSSKHNESKHTEPTTANSKDLSPVSVVQSRTNHKEASDETVQPATIDTAGPPPISQPPQSLPLPQPMAVGSDKGYPIHGNMNNFGRPAQELTQVASHSSMSRGIVIGWDPHQQTYGGERFNKFEDSSYSRNGKPWVRQSSFGSGNSNSNSNGGGGYSRAPPKGQRVCKFYESGRCRRGASCNYWHP